MVEPFFLVNLRHLHLFALQSIRIIFEWFTESNRLEEILERLSILDPPKLYRCCLFLLWLETDKQMQFIPEKRDSNVPDKMIAFLKNYEKPLQGTIVSRDFLSFLMYKMYLTYI